MIWKLIPKFRRKNATSWELLEAVIAAIKAEPKRLNMSSWLDTAARKNRQPKQLQPACDTVGCIAGWMATITAPKATVLTTLRVVAPQNVAYSLLPASIREDTLRLFYGAGSSSFGVFALHDKYPFPESTPGTQRYARAAIKNIRAFMKENEAELKAHVIDAKHAHGVQ